jgi:DNA repair exonuclease SbcCD ATPase subunit
MDSYNLKELQEAYRNLEKTLLELEEQKLTIQTAYNLMVQQNKALESSLSVSRLENMRYEKELKNLEECYESRIEGIRLEYQNEIYNLNFKQGRVRDKQDIKITELENKISALETEKVFGYNELGRITNERNDFEVNYTNLLNEKIENERSLKEKIAILKEQLSSARKDGFIQSLASSSQGIFTACLPSAISCRVNNFIQVYSATKMIGLAPASSGYIFVGIIFVSI